MSPKQIDNYLFDFTQELKRQYDVYSCLTNGNSVMVYYNEKKLFSTWKNIMKVAKKYTKIHYVMTSYANDKSKYYTASALFEYKNKTRSLYIYIKNGLHTPKRRK